MKYRDFKSELKRHVPEGESIVWTGQPKQGIIFRTADVFLIPFSLLWLGFAIFWMYMAGQTSPMFALFGVPFVLFGLFFAFGRFVVDSKYRESSVYGLTENRIIIKSGLRKKEIRNIDLHSSSNFVFTENNDGTGSIEIGPRNPLVHGVSGLNWMPGVKSNTQLEMISNVQSVYNMILELKNKKK
ncbi:MAG: hypothetical protein IPP95_07050 [Flavobacteriales bacterium]|nr:MAG: hypothetical protein IPP95_07050 [Flavobacteriales bacterium]